MTVVERQGRKQPIEPCTFGKMLAPCRRPPGGLGGGIANVTAPLRPPHFTSFHAVEMHISARRIEVCESAQHSGFAGTGRPFHGEAFTRRYLE
jgi:hypothetical protein